MDLRFRVRRAIGVRIVTPFKGLRQGQSISASEYTGLGRSIAGAHGTGAARVSMVNGRLQVHVDHPARHPFEIVAAFNTPTPTAVLCTVTFGQIGGFTPLFPGSSGDPLSDTPAPVHTISLTADVYYFTLVATVTKDGVLNGAYIDVDTTAPTNTNPVPDDMPDEGDTGTAGEYVFPLGEVEIYNDSGVYSFVVRQTLSLSQTFHFCDGSGYIVGV